MVEIFLRFGGNKLYVETFAKNLKSFLLESFVLDDIQHLCADQNQGRSKLSLVLGTIPHLLILAFTIFVVWTAKPSSSE